LSAFGFAKAESITNDAFWKQINYGWVCPVNMELDFVSNTIFKTSPAKAIYKEDVIRLLLGLHERGLVTQYGSNQYYVTPFSKTETFTELSYFTNGDLVVSNTIVKTNAFGYWMDFLPFLRTQYHPYLPQVPFDDNADGMLSKYIDTRTIYDGATNFSFWASRSNLFDYLYIGGNVQTQGDMSFGKYLFTAVPGWTNVFTNYPVCYTQVVASYTYNGSTASYEYISDTQQNIYDYYHPLTNIAIVTNAYLSRNSQVVNYSTELLETETYISTQFWWNVTNLVTRYITDRPRYRCTNSVFNIPQLYSQTNITHYQRGDGGWWSYRYGGGDIYYLWQELGGGTEWEKYPLSDQYLTWPSYSHPSAEGMWAEDEGFIGLRRQQAYRIILEERYKELQSFQHTTPACSYTGFSRTATMSHNNTDAAGLETLKADAEIAFITNALIADAQTPCAYAQVTRSGTAPTNLNWTVTLKRSYGIWTTGYVSTNVAHDKPQAYVRGRTSSALWTFDNQGDNINSTNGYTLLAESEEEDVRTNYTFIVGNASLPVPSVWPDTPTNNATWTKGYLTDATDRKVVIPWHFLYCTNKYW